MGTNYYTVEDDPCPCCERPFERLHIGKSSAGWAFLFAPYPDLGLTSKQAWMVYLETRGIRDEYGSEIPLEELKEVIDGKQGLWTSQTAPRYAWGPSSRDCESLDRDGFRFANTADFS